MTIQSSVQGVFSDTGTSNSVPISLRGSLSLLGTFTATILLERSADGGVTWGVVETYTAAAEATIDGSKVEYLYRVRCSDHTSGNISYVLGQ